MMDPAQSIIEICGGIKAVSEITGRTIPRVRRWTYPRERGGTDGLIPSDAAQLLMREAARRQLPLAPHHFFPDYNGRTEQGSSSSQPADQAPTIEHPHVPTSQDT